MLACSRSIVFAKPSAREEGQRAWRECLEEDFCSSLTSELQVFGGLLSGCMRCTRARLPIWRVLGFSEMWRAGLITSVSEAVGMCTVARCGASVIDSWAFLLQCFDLVSPGALIGARDCAPRSC